MKAIYAFALSLALGSALQAQDFITLRDEAGNTVNGTLLIHMGDAYAAVEEADVWATLNSGSPRNINMRRYELNVQPATQNYFCWGVCYGPQDAGALPVWSAQSQHSIVLNEGVEVSNFHAYHVPLGQIGSSVYRYVWFDTASPTDSVWVDIEFQSLVVGINEPLASASMNVFPNPSKGSDVQIDLTVMNVNETMDLVVFNALGERVQTVTVRGMQPTVRVVTAALSPGLYFASLLHKGNTLITRRFVVSGR